MGNKYNFRGIRKMSKEMANELRKECVKPVEDTAVSENSVISEIFAPDPQTGNPSSDLYFRLGASPDVRNFIEQNLQSQLAERPSTDDVDLALTATKTRFETSQEFGDRIRKFISSQNEKK